MLREITAVRQIPGEARRRWFQDEEMDLFVWLGERSQIVGFQLAYDKPNAEKAITWRAATGFRHARVDDGARPGHHPGSPLLVSAGAFDAPAVLGRFREAAAAIDPEIMQFVAARLAEYTAVRPGGAKPEPPAPREPSAVPRIQWVLAALALLLCLAIVLWLVRG